MDAGPVADAAASDARPADAGLPAADAGPDASPHNPHGIALTEATPALYHGGRSHPDPWGIGSGVAIADLTGDGLPDLVLARMFDPASERPGGPPTLLVNLGGFAFAEDAAFAAALDGVHAHGVAVADYDGDGDLDVFLAATGFDVLLDNDGAGAFDDATARAGVAGPGGDQSIGALWADLNRDGRLDLYVAQYASTAPPSGTGQVGNRLYLNRGDGLFEPVAGAGGAAGAGATNAALASDLDNDGDLELYCANDQFAVDGVLGLPDSGLSPDAWYSLQSIDGEGVPAFADRAASRGITAPRSSMGVALGDVDADGLDDLYVTDWGPNHLQLWNPDTLRYDVDDGAWGLGVRDTGDPTELLVSWGARFVDLDRDGWRELYVVNGAITEPISCSAHRQLDRFLRRADATPWFRDVTALVGLPDGYPCPAPAGAPISGRGLAIGDLDGDGDDDLIVTGYVEPYRFYRNDTPQAGRHRVRVRLRGTVSAPDPVGAALIVTLPGGRKLRATQYAGGDTHSHSDRVLEIGLDGETEVADARVLWPSGLIQRIDGEPWFALDTVLAIEEPAWLELSADSAAPGDPAPVLTYRGAPGAAFTMARGDGVVATATEVTPGVFEVPLPHPGIARVTALELRVGGVLLRPRPSVRYD